MSESEREAWRMEFTFEFQDEEEADAIFKAFTDSLEDMEFTHWSAKMFRDAEMEKALATFRENKEEILANLPPAVVEAYYPDRKEERHLSVVPELEKGYEEGDKNAS